MGSAAIGFFATLFLWWFSTGAILLICSRPQRLPRLSVLIGGGALLALSLVAIRRGADLDTAFGAYISFLGAVGLWGWLEIGFLTGLVTGPSNAPCPVDARGWRRFNLAVLALTWHSVNPVGLLTFVILLVMRVSAELNIFLGVPYLPDSLLPERLSYLKSYFRTSPINRLFPVSIIGASLAAILLGQKALVVEGGQSVGFALLFTLICLAILEHFFMVIPWSEAMLWRWARPNRAP
jgi:putative photosynthetic complex assembly protein 2